MEVRARMLLWWSYLQVSYKLLREAYIAITRNDTSGTSGDSDKCNSFKFGNEWCGRLPPPTDAHNIHIHMHVHTQHTCTYTNIHAHEQPCQCNFFLRSYDIQNCSLIARPLFSFPSLSERTAMKQNAAQHQLLIKLREHNQQNCSGALLLSHTN